MYLLFLAGFAIAGLFAVDEQVHPSKYDNTPAQVETYPASASSINLDAPASDAE